VPSQLISPDDVANDSLVQLFETVIGAGDENDSRVEDLIRVGGGAYDLRLANTGDEVYLYDSSGTLVDSVSFGPTPETNNVATENQLKLDDSMGAWNGYSLERIWGSYSWATNASGWALKMTPSPGKLNGTIPTYGGEDPFGDGIPDNVVINEVFFGPVQQDLYNGHNGPTTWQFNQFIEIFNPTDHNINVTGWTIENNDGVKWMFVKGKHADELGDSDILLIWPDRNDDQANDTYMDPDDNYSPWWQWWNNVDKMETWYEGDDFRWWVDVKGNTPPPSYSKQYELHNLTPTTGEFLLDSAGDYVILRNQTGGIVDVVCWGSGYSHLPADAKAIVGDQNAGSNHGIGANESLERIWQDHYPVADFLYGPGVYHLPTPGKIMGEVPDEIEEERSDSWENAAGTSTRGDCGLGLIIQSTSENSSHIQVNKWLYNPKDHLTSGNLTLKGVTFWRLIANVSINPLIVTVCYGDLSSVDESTLKMYAWDHEANVWVEITTSRDEANNRITGQTILNSSISETVWIGVFGESTGGLGEIPGFNIAFILLGLIGIIIIALKWKVKELKI